MQSMYVSMYACTILQLLSGCLPHPSTLGVLYC